MGNKKFLILFIFTFLFPTLSAYGQTRENPPIIHFAYAQDNIRQGDIWKIYLSVSDPTGKMLSIVCRIDQDGGVRHRPSVIYLKKGMQSGFTGYFSFPTSDASAGNLWGEDWILQFTFADRAGMLVGAGIFAEAFTFLKDNLLKWGDLGRLTLPMVIGINHWIVIPIIWAVAFGILIGLEKRRL